MKKNNVAVFMAVILFCFGPGIAAAEAPVESAQNSSMAAAGGDEHFMSAAALTQRQLLEALSDLTKTRVKIAEEKIPLGHKLSELESEAVKVRLDYQQASRTLDTRTLDLNNLRSEINSRKEEMNYLSNLLGEYIRNFEARLHIAELQRYSDKIKAAKLAAENTGLPQEEIYKTQADLVVASIDRLEDAFGGTRFEGEAVTPSGLVKKGAFVVVGPVAIFRSDDGRDIGTVEQRLGSLEPAVVAFENKEDSAAAANLIKNSSGDIPIDPTLGSAHKMEGTKETLWEHILKGGPVMAPILGLALAAFLVGLYKWNSMRSLRSPSQAEINALLNAVAGNNQKTAVQKASAIGGPIGKMLAIGAEHMKEPRELIEEVMFEAVMATRIKLQSMLPFIAMSASCAPLLGLLGTVTGIINTFKMITVFGSGDVKMLSGGISEALITTEYGLIVAIPSLLLHAFLSRKARGILDQMEKAAINFINCIAKSAEERAKGDLRAAGRSLDANEEMIKV